MQRVIQGIDLASVQDDQFFGCVQGRTLIVDGDGPCYVVAATTKRMDTAIRRFQEELLKRMFLTKSSNARVHLTAKNSDKFGRFRVKAVKPYQGQRDSSAKPALLEPLREAMADRSNWLDDFDVQLHRDIEADDAMMQDAYVLKENGIMNSEDKDLRMTPYPWYDHYTGRVMPGEPVGWVDVAYTEGGTVKMVGQGPMFFWGQMLAGDGADNIKGVIKLDGKLCGPRNAVDALRGMRSIDTAANFVIDAYRRIDQNVLAEGWLLWLTRWRGDNVVRYLDEIRLDADNYAFVQDCLHRDWVIPKEVHERTEATA